MMITVWGRNNSINVQKVMWAIGELELEHKRHDIGRQFGGLQTSEYKSMNPNGLIPTLSDDGFVVWESNTIVRYLASKYGRGTLWPENMKTCIEADQWMDWMITSIIPNLNPLFVELIRTAPDKQNLDNVSIWVEDLASSWKILENYLVSRDFIGGDNFSMGDIPVGCAFYRYKMLEIKRPDFPALDVWYNRLKSRDAYKKHVMIELS